MSGLRSFLSFLRTACPPFCWLGQITNQWYTLFPPLQLYFLLGTHHLLCHVHCLLHCVRVLHELPHLCLHFCCGFCETRVCNHLLHLRLKGGVGHHGLDLFLDGRVLKHLKRLGHVRGIRERAGGGLQAGVDAGGRLLPLQLGIGLLGLGHACLDLRCRCPHHLRIFHHFLSHLMGFLHVRCQFFHLFLKVGVLHHGLNLLHYVRVAGHIHEFSHQLRGELCVGQVMEPKLSIQRPNLLLAIVFLFEKGCLAKDNSQDEQCEKKLESLHFGLPTYQTGEVCSSRCAENGCSRQQ
mmetsp:Transcript_7589/g.13218  ORF Transcript_7589/g.13218 Transcript_7589/m.13218 type:complete len:294 (+) Transcript_7589:184-1065(+)